MAKIHIKWLSDTYNDCETCGMSWAEGALVYIDGSLAIDLTPVAHCYGGANYDRGDVYERLLARLGHTLEHA